MAYSERVQALARKLSAAGETFEIKYPKSYSYSPDVVKVKADYPEVLSLQDGTRLKARLTSSFIFVMEPVTEEKNGLEPLPGWVAVTKIRQDSLGTRKGWGCETRLFGGRYFDPAASSPLIAQIVGDYHESRERQRESAVRARHWQGVQKSAQAPFEAAAQAFLDAQTPEEAAEAYAAYAEAREAYACANSREKSVPAGRRPRVALYGYAMKISVSLVDIHPSTSDS
jgi:hypothetical protein